MKKRIVELDYLRGFAILGVLAIHVIANFTKFSTANFLAVLNMGIDVLTHFAVPLFVAISGFLYRHIPDLKAFYRRRFLSVLPSYLFFSLLYTFIKTVRSHSFDVLKAGANLLLANSYYHLWFFALLFQLYFLHPFLVTLYDELIERYKQKNVLVVAFIISVSWNVSTYFLKAQITTNYESYMVATLFSLILSRVFLSQLVWVLCQDLVQPKLGFCPKLRRN